MKNKKERKIKFRAWLKKPKRMVNLENRLKIKVFLDNTYYIDNDTINDSNSFFDESEFDLMQFTGLKDKQGKDPLWLV